MSTMTLILICPYLTSLGWNIIVLRPKYDFCSYIYVWISYPFRYQKNTAPCRNNAKLPLFIPFHPSSWAPIVDWYLEYITTGLQICSLIWPPLVSCNSFVDSPEASSWISFLFQQSPFYNVSSVHCEFHYW